ncbi:MAG: hypothetical protein BWZ07_02516 [Alphaproteobacteria bacterium ADurb.BinA280]|nr:MAG: hypothetical protein BWZ07_02516 [Alphaproteobacteria bacterium ADurb.BinA280]
MRPIPKVASSHTWVTPLQWKIGDDAVNIAAMLETSTRNAMKLLPGTDANGYVYSLSERRMLDAGGEVVARERLVDLASKATATLKANIKASGGKPDKAVVGDTTVARAISVQSLIRQQQGRSSLLAEIAGRLSSAGIDSDPLYRAFYSASAPTFYSAMLQAVEAGNGAPKRADATAWMQWLDGAARRGEIKADERYWLGLDEWLDSQQGPITREALADFVRANGVQVTETVLGDSFESMPIDRLRDQWERVFNGDAYDMSRSEMVEMLEAEGDIGNRAADGVPKYGEYTLPGGTNYREVLLTLPEKQNVRKRVLRKDGDGRRPWRIYIEGEELHQNSFTTEEAAREDLAKYPTFSEKAGGQAYQSNHWDQKNVLAHIRVNDRTDADGKRVLFVEEIQSDWGQEGKKKGFASPPVPADEMAEMERQLANLKAKRRELVAAARASGSEQVDAEAERVLDEEAALQSKINAAKRAATEGVPIAPFVDKTDKWLTLALKRVLRMAVDGGYDRVAFVNGEQSADRYDLSKQVDQLLYRKNDDGTYQLSAVTGGTGRMLGEAIPANKLEDYVGKEIAERIVKGDGKRTEVSGKYDPVSMTSSKDYMQSLSGIDLKGGGEGMKAFYDKIVPAAVKDLLKKVGGGQMESVEIAQGNDYVDKSARSTQTGFTINAAMRQKVSAGLPLFSRSQPQVIPPVQPASPGVPTQGTMPQAVAARGKIADLTSPESFDRLIYEFQDKFIDLRRVQDRITELGGAINDINDAYLGEELFHARLAKRTQNFLRDELKPLLASLKAAGIAVTEFETFLHARHAPEANAVLADRNPNKATIDQARATALAAVKSLELQLQTAQVQGTSVKAINDALDTAREDLARWNRAQAFRGTEAERLSLSGMTDSDAAAHMAAIDPGKRVTLDALAAKIDAMQSKTLDTLVSYGLMDKASIDAWRQTYQYYIPLHRDEAHPDSVAHPTGSGFNVRGGASRGRTGSNEKVTHILSHIAMQREAALTRGEKNHVVKKLYLMAKQNKDPDFWTVDTPLTSKIVDPSTGFVRQQVDPLFKSRPHVVMLRIAGKDRAIVFNEHNKRAVRLAHSLKNLDVDDLHYVLGAAAKATRWFASVNTQYNPVFGFLNLWRDAQSAVLNLSSTALRGKQFAVLARVLPAMRAVYRERRGKTPTNNRLSRMWEEMQIEGGVTGYRDLFRDAGERAKAIDSELRSMDRGKVSKAAHAIVDWLDHYNTALENAVRLAAYDVALSQGMSKPRAASVAKNLTVNFNRKGRQTREIGALYAFFNASVQGNARTLQTLAGPAGKAIVAGGIGIGFVASMLAAAFMGEDDYEKIPDFVRERSLVIPIGGGKYFSWPYPLGFHVLPNLGRIAAEMMMGVKKPMDGYVDTMMIAADTFSPLGSASGGPAQMLSPTALDPAVALMQNSDWTGMPIYREDFNSLDPTPGHTRVKDSASLPAKVLSQFANWATGGNDYKPGRMSPTPDQIDFITGQITGGLGREIMKAMQVLQAPFSDDELPLHKVPLVGRVIGSTSGQSGEAGRFYAAIRELNVLGSELDGRIKSGDDPQDFMLENPKANLIEFGKIGQVFR